MILFEVIDTNSSNTKKNETAQIHSTLQPIINIKLNVTLSRAITLIVQQIEIIKASPLHGHN